VNLLISESVILPPGVITCVRDVTLYAVTFNHYDVLIETHDKDLIFGLLTRFGALDFVSDIVHPGEEYGVTLNNEPGGCSICVDCIDYTSLSFIITKLTSQQK